MKNEHRRRYTREFKLQALDMAETSGKSVAQIEDELGLAPGMMYRWKRQFQQVGKEAYQSKGKLADSDQEVRRLRREMEQLRERGQHVPTYAERRDQEEVKRDLLRIYYVALIAEQDLMRQKREKERSGM